MPVEMLKVLAAPKPWHGHPLASIRRGIAVLGSARCYALDRSTIDELTILRNLYFDDQNLIDRKLVELYHLPSANAKRKRSEDEPDFSNDRKKCATDAGVDDDDDDDDDNAAAGESHNAQKATGNSEHVQDAGEYGCLPIDASGSYRAYEHTEWVLGPNSTGNDAIKRFAPLLRTADVINLLR